VPGEWKNIVFRFNGTAIEAFENGAFRGFASFMGAFKTPLDRTLRVGASGVGANQFHGALDEVMVFDTAISDCKVTRLYDSFVAPSQDEPAAVPSVGSDYDTESNSYYFDFSEKDTAVASVLVELATGTSPEPSAGASAVEYDSPPEGTSAYQITGPEAVYKYIDITTTLGQSQSSVVSITFSVPVEWANEHGSANGIKIYHFDSGSWVDTNAYTVGAVGNYYQFKADVPHLSGFVIVGGSAVTGAVASPGFDSMPFIIILASVLMLTMLQYVARHERTFGR